MNINTMFDGVGITGKVTNVYQFKESVNLKVTSMCLLSNSLYISTSNSIYGLSLVTGSIQCIVGMERGFYPYKLKARKDSLVFTDPKNMKVFSFNPSNNHPKIQ